jgi:XisI protein
MEKVNKKIQKYEKVIVDLLNQIKGTANEHIIITDKDKRHYQLLYLGLDSRNAYTFNVRIHFHLRPDGVICLYENRTEEELGDVLMEKGIPKSDILAGFLPESARQYAGYAVA